MNIKIGNDWDNELADLFNSKAFQKLNSFVDNEYENKTIYPPKEDIFKALRLTSFENTRVVIVGQDPYHEEGQATGLAFSVNEGIKLPPSLKNIYKEIENEYGIKMSNNGNLDKWAKQGVLLLNNVLTVEAHKANSHKNIGWEEVTNYIIRKLNNKKSPVIFVMWGNNAKGKIDLISNPKHVLLTSAHPSPLSAYNGFFGNNHFKKINEILRQNNMEEIDFAN